MWFWAKWRLGSSDTLASKRAMDKLVKGKAFDVLVSALQSGNKNARAAAAEGLGCLRDRRASDPLIRTLKDTDSIVRSRAAEALSRIPNPDPPTVDALIDALGDDFVNTRSYAVRALQPLGDTRAMPALGALLLREASGERCYKWLIYDTVDALVRIGPESAVDYFVEFLLHLRSKKLSPDSNSEDIYRASCIAKVSSIVQNIPCSKGNLREQLRRAVACDNRRACDWRQPELYDILIRSLKALYISVRVFAANCLGELTEYADTTAPQLTKLFNGVNESSMVKVAAAEALVKLNAKQACTILICELADVQYGIRWAAARLLGDLGDAKAIPALQRALGDKSESLRALAAEALKKIASKQPAVEANVAASAEGILHRLFEKVLGTLQILQEADIRREYDRLSLLWGSRQLVQGDESAVRQIVSRNLARIAGEPEFIEFQLSVEDSKISAQVNAIFAQSFVPVRIWRTSSQLMVCGNSLFS